MEAGEGGDVYVPQEGLEILIQLAGGAAGRARELLAYMQDPVSREWVLILDIRSWDAWYFITDLEKDGQAEIIIAEVAGAT